MAIIYAISVAFFEILNSLIYTIPFRYNVYFSAFDSRQNEESFLYSKASWRALGPPSLIVGTYRWCCTWGETPGG